MNLLDDNGKPFYLQFQDKWIDSKTYYFAYGSNMSEKRMKEERKIKFHSRKKAILKDYKLVFNKMSESNNEIGFANIVKSVGDFVEGVLYEINSEDIKRLNKYEGFPKHYLKDIFYIGGVYAHVYLANPDWVREGIKPSQKYLDYLLEGKDLLSEKYYNNLLLTETKKIS